MSPKRTIDLNADVGEAADAEGVEAEGALLAQVTTAHIACGGHTGDDESMERTVAAALEQSVRVGAHPSYPDPAGFGRRPMAIERGELRASLNEQLRALARVCRAAGTTIESVKAHGALYEEVAKGGAIYEAFRDAVRDSYGETTALVLPSGCRATAMALRDGMVAREEGFCDRAYRPDGTLVERGDARRHPERPGGGGRAGGLPRPGCRGGGRRQRAHLVGGHAVHPRRHRRGGGDRRRGPSGHGGRGDRRGRTTACMTRSIPDGEVRPLGDRAFLIGVADPASGRALVGCSRLGWPMRAPSRWCAASPRSWCRWSTPTLELEAVLAVTEEVLAHDAPRRTVEGRGERGRMVTVPCAFDGPDLQAVATSAGCSPDEVVRS